MYPSSLRMRAISIFRRDAGTSTLVWRAPIAFRMRVSMSEIGSVIFMSIPIDYKFNATRARTPAFPGLPTRFGHPRNLPVERQLAEADAADAELANVSARPTTAFAAVVAAHFVFWSSVRLNDF